MKTITETKPDEQVIMEYKAEIKALRKHLSEYFNLYQENKRLYESQVKISEFVKNMNESTKTNLNWFMKQYAQLIERDAQRSKQDAQRTKQMEEMAAIISRQRDLLKKQGIKDDTGIQNKTQNFPLTEYSAKWINNNVLYIWYLPTTF